MTTARVFRRDVYSSDALAAPLRLPNGWLRVDAKISRVGLQEYEDADGTHFELRLPEEVFNPDSIASLQMVPVTNTHPPVLLSDENTGTYSKGHSGENVRQLDETWLGSPLMLTDGPTIRAATGGRNQLSVGYTCELDPTQDAALIAKYGAYKFIQRKIRGNHIALVDEARAGPEAKLRLDNGAARMVTPHTDDVRQPGTERAMSLGLKIGTMRLDMTDANHSAIQARIDEEIANATSRADQKISEAVARADAADKKLKILRDGSGRLVARFNLVRSLVLDGMKAKMTPCDECGGTGKVTDDADETKMKTCDFCDGAGSFRMHSPVGGKAGAEKDAEGDLEEAVGEEEQDATELEVEQETETQAGEANKDRKDKKRADSRKRRTEEYVAQQKALTDSRVRMLNRAIRARVKLLDAARKVLGDEFDFSKLDSAAIKREVVKKLAPAAKLDGKSDAQIGERFEAEMERVDSGAQGVDEARSVVAGERVVTDTRGGAKPRGRDAYLARNDEIAKVAAGQKPVEKK